MPLNIPNPCDDPATADQRVADTLEVLIPNAADRALVLISVSMAVKAHRVHARREALAEASGKAVQLEAPEGLH